ncbi:DUF402 domain-containing protein [Caldicellulosiruptoraceae bacterium PP1]
MKIIRKRYIPEEEIDISGDIILFHNEDILITKWLPIHKRQDIVNGMSCLFFKEGIKISKMYNSDNRLLYTYCDIVRTNIKDDTLIIEDLLLDVVIYPDKTYKVLDIDELIELRKNNKISEDLMLEALSKLNYLLNDIYNGFTLDVLEKRFWEV